MTESSVASRRLLLLGLGTAVVGGTLVWRGWQHRSAVPSEPPAGEAPTAEGLGSATLVNDAQPVPEFRLQGPAGEITRAQMMGRWHLVFFGYTQCPDVCPGSLSLLNDALAGLPQAQRPGVLFISVDPARDTPELLGQYVPAFHPDFVGAAGRDEQIAALVKHLGVHYERHEADAGGHYTVDHTASFFLLDPQARLRAVYSPPHQAGLIAASLQRLMGA